MKKTLILSAVIALSFATLLVNAGNSPVPETTASPARINMQGPSTVSLSGGSYTYSVHLLNGSMLPGTKWVIQQLGHIVAEFPADDPVNDEVSISLSGSSFGATGSATVYLVGITDDGFGLIYGNKGVTVTP